MARGRLIRGVARRQMTGLDLRVDWGQTLHGIIFSVVGMHGNHEDQSFRQNTNDGSLEDSDRTYYSVIPEVRFPGPNFQFAGTECFRRSIFCEF